jgi:hypothetical protein
VHDMHPTIEEVSAPKVSETEFKFDDPIQIQNGNPELIQSPTGSIAMPPHPPSPALPTGEDKELENDIRNLTESTIKLSGLDEFEWNLDDAKKMKTTPASAPVQPKNENSEVFHRATVTSLQDRTREITRPAPVITSPSKPLDDGGSNFPLHVSTGPDSSVGPSIDVGSAFESKALGSVKAAPVVSMAEIEKMIRKDVEQMLEKMARETIPKMAEAIIKKEIEKILAE